MDKYERCEAIALAFSQHAIPAITALSKHNKHLFIYGDNGYLVYPYIEGYTLQRGAVSENHALTIAQLTAQLHTTHFTIPQLPPQRFDVHESPHLLSLISQSHEDRCSFAPLLTEHQSWLLEINQRYQSAIPTLQETATLTHGDIDQLNMIWDTDDQPTLIDWESARLMNPTQEIVRTSLSWSGIGSDSFSLPLYKHMILTYRQHGAPFEPTHLTAALYSVYGSMINWIRFNITVMSKASQPNSEKTAHHEIINAIARIKKIDHLMTDLL